MSDRYAPRKRIIGDRLVFAYLSIVATTWLLAGVVIFYHFSNINIK